MCKINVTDFMHLSSPLKDRKTHKLLYDVLLEDCGPKMGAIELITGSLIFENVRIPENSTGLSTALIKILALTY